MTNQLKKSSPISLVIKYKPFIGMVNNALTQQDKCLNVVPAVNHVKPPTPLTSLSCCCCVTVAALKPDTVTGHRNWNL